jgi:ABC-2 type transport system permease protein
MTQVVQAGAALPPEPAAVALTAASEARAVAVVCRREVVKFRRARGRILSGLAQPLVFLLVLGVGLTPLVESGSGIDFKVFIFPGVLAMSVLSTAAFDAMSIVWDREVGFLREMLVSPVSRSSILVGRALGGATVATLQGALMLPLAPLIGVPLSLVLALELLAITFLAALGVTSIGIFVASYIQQPENFQAIMQLLVFPMLFLSGAMFPLRGLPGWLGVLTRLNPVTYTVDPVRRVLLQHEPAAPGSASAWAPGLELLGHTLPVWLELVVIVAMAVALLGLSLRAFGRPE